jgi:hypothetical protein
MHRLRRTCIAGLSGLSLMVFIAWTASAQQAARPAAQAAPQAAAVVPRPPVFFHEAWKKPEGPDPRRVMAQEWVGNPNLELKLYGPGTSGKGLEHQDEENFKRFAGSLIVNVRGEPDNWAFIWSGFTEGNWALTLRDKNSFVNLSGPLTKIRWKSLQSGFALLRPVIKTADGKYYVGDKTDGLSPDWHENEIIVADVRWLELNPMGATEATVRGGGVGWQNPDLSRVDEIGFTTLSRGTAPGSGASARIAWIEVVGHPVPRAGKSN